jgi:hypothetical protein
MDSGNNNLSLQDTTAITTDDVPMFVGNNTDTSYADQQSYDTFESTDTTLTAPNASYSTRIIPGATAVVHAHHHGSIPKSHYDPPSTSKTAAKRSRQDPPCPEDHRSCMPPPSPRITTHNPYARLLDLAAKNTALMEQMRRDVQALREENAMLLDDLVMSSVAAVAN